MNRCNSFFKVSWNTLNVSARNLPGLTSPLSFIHTGKKVQIRKPAPGLSDIAPSRRTSRPVIISSSTLKKGATQHRPLRERLLHLLALKPYKKPELILRLQKDGISQLDKDSLDSHLQQVTLTNIAFAFSVVIHFGLNLKLLFLIILDCTGPSTHLHLLFFRHRWQTLMGKITPSRWRTFCIKKFRKTGQATQRATSSFSRESCFGMLEIKITSNRRSSFSLPVNKQLLHLYYILLEMQNTEA